MCGVVDKGTLAQVLAEHAEWLAGTGGRPADLGRADLRGTDLRGAELPDFEIVPAAGEFVAWKKVQGAVLRLRIPAGAARTACLVGRTCRAEYAIVDGVESASGATVESWKSENDPGFVYRVGETATPDSYDPDIRVECTHGIHFFMTREEVAT